MPVKNELGRPTRTNSIFGTIKSILPSTFSWLKSAGNDTPTKRKGGHEVTEEEGRGNKRQKLDTPTQPMKQATRSDQEQQRAPTTNGYLDAPENFFRSTGTAGSRRLGAHVRSTSLVPSAPRHLSNSRPGHSTDYRRTVRTQSMDPPARHRLVVPTAAAPTRKPIPLTRDISMDDETLGMTRSQSFQMRTSLTPQPMGQNFGPAPVRRERDGSEPPPLAQLIDKPIFVKAPLEPLQTSVKRSQVTLGSLADAQRAGRPMQRSHSTLALDSNSAVHDLSTPIVINTTEKVLRELEAYKTPLLPTRLQGSTVIPEMFKTKKARRIALMHDREKKPRLGMADKASASEKSVDEAAGVKPYAGRGGMKKLLARRQMEEEEEKEKERASAIETDEEEAEQARHAKALDEKLAEELRKAPTAPEPERPRSFVGGREQSSLRVGRQRTSRNHIARPQAKPRGGRFSAIYEEEDEDAMEDNEREKEIRELEEAAKKVPTFNIPAGFSFAQNTAPIKFDTTHAKEPPVASLPFSFAALSGSSTSSPPSAFSAPSKANGENEKTAEKPASVPLPSGFSQPAPSPPITVAAESHAVSAPAPLTPLISAAPQIALIPPTPGVGVAATAPSQPASEQLDQSIAGKASSAVPNFFASSLTKSTSAPATPPSFSFAPSPASSAPAPLKESFSLFGSAPKSDAPAPTAPSSLFGAPTPSTPATEETPAATESKAAPAPPSIFGGFGSSTATSAFLSSATSSAPAPVSLFPPSQSDREPTAPNTTAFPFSKPANTSTTPAVAPVTFGVTKPAESSASPAAPSLQFGFVPKAASKEPESRPGTGDAAKPASLFGAPPPAPTAFTGFGTPSPSVPEPPKSPFLFGQAGQAPTTPSAPVASVATPLKIETPKPLFGGNTNFTFGQPAATSTPEPTKSPFGFGTSTAPATPTAESNMFKFGQPSAPVPTTNAPASGSVFGAPAAAPETPQKAPTMFGFGTSTPRQVTPPKDDSEVMMDESPQRSMTMDTNGKPDLSKITGFNFNTNGASSPFGQPAQNTGFTFNSNGAATSNPFGTKTEAKPADKPGFVGFGTGSTTNGFTFGGQKAPEPPQAPTATGFTFSPATTSAPSTGFPFSAPQMAQSTSFGSGTGSAAVSPSPFTQPAQPAGFGFVTPTTATSTNNPFGFGSSQPASPAVANPGLPGQNNGGAFAFGGSVAANAAAPASSPSPFTPSAPLPQSGTTLFTLGAAPPPNPGMAGRVTKKLPNRRGGKR